MSLATPEADDDDDEEEEDEDEDGLVTSLPLEDSPELLGRELLLSMMEPLEGLGFVLSPQAARDSANTATSRKETMRCVAFFIIMHLSYFFCFTQVMTKKNGLLLTAFTFFRETSQKFARQLWGKQHRSLHP